MVKDHQRSERLS